MKAYLPSIALGLALTLLGSVVPVMNLLEFWQLPVGTGIRPMGAPVAFLLWGCGTPLAVIGVATLGFSRRFAAAESPRHCVIGRVVLALTCMLSFIPAVLTTFGLKWVIDARQLWLKP